jgi:hypothetical protein
MNRKRRIRIGLCAIVTLALVICRMPTTAPVSARGAARQTNSAFPIGVFEDGNMLAGKTALFEAMLKDLRRHGLDSVMFTNNKVSRDARLLGVSDRLGFNVFMLPAFDLAAGWWPADVPARIETARAVARPIVKQLGSHPSLKGYLVKDEPGRSELSKVALMTQALRELDPARTVTPILVGTDRVGPIFAAAQPGVMLIDVYPIGYENAACDFRMTGFGYQALDFVSYIRLVTRDKPAATPLWVILQTHSFLTQLREPSIAEVRAQHWMAIGEGAKGIFWFIYGSQQGRTGLADNPPLFGEVAALARRVALLRSTLLPLLKAVDRFTISGEQQPYVSTLTSANHARLFVVAVNRDCERRQMLTIGAPSLKGRLRDLETSRTYALGSAIEFRPGDGKIFEFVPNRSDRCPYNTIPKRNIRSNMVQDYNTGSINVTNLAKRRNISFTCTKFFLPLV